MRTHSANILYTATLANQLFNAGNIAAATDQVAIAWQIFHIKTRRQQREAK